MTSAQNRRAPLSGNKLRCLLIGIAISSCASGTVTGAWLLSGEEGPADKDQRTAVVRTIRGDSFVARLSEFGPAAIGFENRKVKTRDVLRLSFPGRSIRPARSFVVLTNDDAVEMNVREINEESFVGTFADRSNATIPLEYVKGWLIDLPETTALRNKAWQLLRQGSEVKEDTVALRSGDSLAGELLGLTDDRVQIETTAGLRSVALREVVGIRMNPDLLSPIAKRATTTVQTTSHETITLSKLEPQAAGQLRMATVWGATLNVPLDRVTAIDWHSPPVVRVNELEPQAAKREGYFGAKAVTPWRRNRSIRGEPMLHRQERFAHGIGTSSRSKLTWAIRDLNATAFHSQFGLDDAGPSGSAIFRVLVDGREVFRSAATRSGRPVDSTPLIALQNARTLTLVVEFDARGDIEDYANWLNPVLLK